MRKATTPVLVLLAIVGVLAGLWIMTQPAKAPAVTVAANEQPNTDSNESAPLSGNTGHETEKPDPDVHTQTTADSTTEAPPTSTSDSGKPAEPEGLVVEGTVVDADTGLPIPHIRFSLGMFAKGADRNGWEPAIDWFDAKSGEDGSFKIVVKGRTELPEDASFRFTNDDFKATEIPATTGHNTLRLEKALWTRVEVSFTGGSSVPANAWLRWLDSDARPTHGRTFNPTTRMAEISLDWSTNLDHRCVVCADWFGQVLESEPLQLTRGKTYSVTLVPPAGALLKVKIIGPDSLPMDGVAMRVGSVIDEGAHGVTDSNGELIFSGIPAPGQLVVHVIGGRDAASCIAPLTCEFVTPGDSIEKLIDLTGTGIVDCELTAGEAQLDVIYMKSLDRRESRKYAALRGRGLDDDARLIYGLLPGMYEVTATHWDTEQTWSAEFEVLAPPAISKWHKHFEPKTLRVRIEGVRSTQGMKLTRWTPGSWPVETLAPAEDGDFLIENLSSNPFEFRVYGGGFASRVVAANPGEVSEITVPVERSGKVKLTPQDGHEADLFVRGITPSQAGFSTYGMDGDVLELPPGQYRAAEFIHNDGAPWEPVLFTVIASETVECSYGPPFTCTLKVRVSDRTELWNLNTLLLKGEEVVPYRLTKVGNGSDEYQQFTFSVEGNLKLSAKGFEYEDFETEFEAVRGKTVTLNIELKRKQ